MNLKNSAITAQIVIESMVTLLENENIDISSIKVTIGNKDSGWQKTDIKFEDMINIALKQLTKIKNGELTE